MCTKADICDVQHRATFLCYAFQLALAKMNEWTWQACCTESCKVLNAFGMMQAASYKTVANWNIVLRKFECFQHPNLSVSVGNDLFLVSSKYIHVQRSRSRHFESRIGTSLNWSSYQFIHSSVIPRLAALWKRESADTITAALASTITTTVFNTTSNPADDIQDEDDIAIQQFRRAHRFKTWASRQHGAGCDCKGLCMICERRVSTSTAINAKTLCHIAPYSARTISPCSSHVVGVGFSFHEVKLLLSRRWTQNLDTISTTLYLTRIK